MSFANDLSDGSLERSDWPAPPSYCVNPVAVLDVEILVADEASEGASVANENTLGTILSVKCRFVSINLWNLQVVLVAVDASVGDRLKARE